MKVALYARVSTKQHGQDVETQLQELRRWAKGKKHRVVGEFCDRGVSGAKERRPELDRLMKAAKRKEFDAVVVWRFDRFARSVRHLLAALEDFNAWGVHFVSLTEQIDTSTPIGRMVFTIMAALAEFIRAVIRENVQSGVNRAKRAGVQLGRPRKQYDAKKIYAAVQGGQAIRHAASQYNLARGTIRNIVARGVADAAKVRRGPVVRPKQKESGARSRL